MESEIKMISIHPPRDKPNDKYMLVSDIGELEITSDELMQLYNELAYYSSCIVQYEAERETQKIKKSDLE
jgi:hypothetical protein